MTEVVIGKQWTREHEMLFVEWADKALCYKWLHSKCNVKYHSLNTWFTVPVIIMSTLTGTANFAQEKFPPGVKEYAPMMIGGVNIIAGIITTVQQFLKIGELNEAHRVASLSWDKFYRKIKVELSKSPEERGPIDVFLKTCAEEFDRLMEISPGIDDNITKMFKATFEGKIQKTKTGLEDLNDRQKAFRELKKPEICDSIESTIHSIYKAPLKTSQGSQIIEDIQDFVKEKTQPTQDLGKIKEFYEGFMSQYQREPTVDELMDNLINDSDEEDGEGEGDGAAGGAAGGGGAGGGSSVKVTKELIELFLSQRELEISGDGQNIVVSVSEQQ